MTPEQPIANNRDLLLECIKINQLSERCRDNFVNKLDDYFDDISFYAFKERIKSASDIQKKVLRKRAEGCPNYNPSNITDGWGCRFVTLFQSDMVDLTNHLLNFANIWNARLKHFHIVETIIYDNRPDDDPLSVAPVIKDLFLSSKILAGEPQVKKTSRNTGYSSVHVVVETHVSEAKKPYEQETGNDPIELIKFEIQIRDIFEDAWSEIAHIFYDARKSETIDPGTDEDATGRHSTSQGHGSFSADAHLNALKAVVDGCCQHANLIRGHIPGLNKSSTDGRNLSITHLDQDRESLLEGTAIEPERKALRKAIIEAYDLLKGAHRTTELSDLEDARPFYIDAAQKFDEAYKLADGRLPVPTNRHKYRGGDDARQQNSQPDKTIEYHLRLERANARMFSLPTSAKAFGPDEDERFARAIEDYEWVRSRYPASASVHLRMGQAYVRNHFNLQNLTKAISFLEKAQELARTDPDIDPDHWIYYEVPLQHAHAYYYSAKLNSPETKNYMNKALFILKSAIEPLNLSIEDDDYKLSLITKIYSNLIFYNYISVEGFSSADAYCDFAVSKNYFPEVIENLKSYLHALLGRQLNRYTENSVETIDSVIIGAMIVGNHDLAISNAEDNFRYLKSFARSCLPTSGQGGEISNVLSERQKRMLWRAHCVMKSDADNFVNDILSNERLPPHRPSRWAWLTNWE